MYEVFRMYGGRRWLEAEHLARLKRSLNELELPPHDLERLVERMDRTTAASGIQEGTIYVQVTRGVAPGARLPRSARAPYRADRHSPLR